MNNESIGIKNCTGLGIGLGLLFGAALGNIPLGLLLGLAFDAIIQKTKK